MLTELSERTIVSLVRTVFYGLVAFLLTTGRSDVAHALSAAVLGGALADYITWFAKSLTELPEHIAHGSYDLAVNLLFATWLFHFNDFRIDDDGSSVAFAFVMFMFVLGSKVGWFALQAVHEQMSDV
jgi:hypothetical protein